MYCLRNVIRILDVEKTRERMTAVEWQDVEFLYLNSFYLMVVYFFLAFLHNKSSLFITCALISIANTFVKYNRNIIKKPGDIVAKYQLLFMVTGAFLSFFISKFLDESFQIAQIEKGRYKKMMNVSTEGILIIKENTIDYVNNKFIE